MTIVALINFLVVICILGFIPLTTWHDTEITTEKTQLGREATKQLQGFASVAKLLLQSEVDTLSEEDKEAIEQKLRPRDLAMESI